MLQPMTRNDLPFVVIQLTFGGNRHYLGRVATLKEVEEYRSNCGLPPSDIVCEKWPVTTVVGSTEGTRLLKAELKEAFSSLQLGQVVSPAKGPFKGEAYRIVGLTHNTFDQFIFGIPL